MQKTFSMKTLSLTFLLVLSINVFSQTKNVETLSIISLEECINLALQNAVELNVSNSQIEQIKSQRESLHTFWLFDNLAITGSSQYVYRRHFDSNIGGGYDPEQNIGTYFGPQSNNNIGLSLRLPLNTFKIKKQAKIEADAAIKEATYNKESQQQQIKQQVITLYHAFETANNNLNSASKLLDIEKMLLNLAEENRQSNKITQEEYLATLREKINAEAAYNSAKIAYEAAYYDLKLRVGSNILK